MATLFDGVEIKNSEEYTLVLSSVSVGNVGQLTVDLVLNNLRTEKIGRIFHSALEPVIGNEISDSGEVSFLTTCQIFRNVEQKLIVVQFHAPVLTKEAENFCQYLATWVATMKFKEVICISSTNASERVDSQIQGRPYRFVATTGAQTEDIAALKQTGWKELERRSFPAPPVYDSSAGPVDAGEDIYIPGSGITKNLMSVFEAKSLPLVVLLMFVSEGDNTQDALDYFKECAQVFKWGIEENETINIPKSWSCMYGTGFPQDIY